MIIRLKGSRFGVLIRCVSGPLFNHQREGVCTAAQDDNERPEANLVFGATFLRGSRRSGGVVARRFRLVRLLQVFRKRGKCSMGMCRTR
jgi:hypothetical protein